MALPRRGSAQHAMDIGSVWRPLDYATIHSSLFGPAILSVARFRFKFCGHCPSLVKGLWLL